MRIGVVNTQVPFVTGGAERHAANLRRALEAYGHEAVEISIPFKWYPGPTLVDHIMAAKLIDLSESTGHPIDMMVGLKFPAYLARHPNKVFWILHQHRQAYDLWDTGHSDLLHQPDGAALREMIREEDRRAFTATPHPIYANSRNVAGRMRRYLGQAGRPLYHPPPNPERLGPGPYGDYLFAPSRLNPGKRQGLMLEALAQTRGVRLVFAGTADAPEHGQALYDQARALGVEDRVTWMGAIDDATMIRVYSEARAVVFTPIDEDYGYITLEAMLSAKPVITVTDAGGPLEFITDGVEGLVTAPSAAGLAAAFERLSEDRALAEKMGAAGLARYRAQKIDWETVVRTLTGGATAPDVHPAPPAPADQAEPGASADPTAAAPHGAAGSAAAPLDTAPETATKAPLAPPIGEIAAGSGAAAPVGPDLEEIRARLRPPAPEGLPFGSIDEVIAAYAFGTYPAPDALGDERIAGYLRTHWRRYLATLALATEPEPRQILDVGVTPPFAFQALLANTLAAPEFHGIWQAGAPYRQRVESRDGTLPGFDVSLQSANAERDRLPHADRSFDLVLAMEIFEHFAVDPFHFLLEAGRVLRPGGRLLLTTPNISSHRGVWKALMGAAPYSFGLFVPAGGAHGRHNREYAPREVEKLAQAAGFDTETLITADVYDRHIEPEAAAVLAARGDDFRLRGETILYLGHKARPSADPPKGVYVGDPLALAGHLSLAGHDRATGITRIRAENRSRAWWPVSGDWAVTLFLEWKDPSGRLVHGEGRARLTEPVGPGEATEIALRLDAGGADGAAGTLMAELFQEGSGRFSGAGRANGLMLSCSEGAFLRLVGAA